MQLKDIIQEDLIVLEMMAQNNNEAIHELVELLVRKNKIPSEFMTETLLSLFKREALGTTGVGKGVAIPHGKLRFVQEVVGALGISRPGLDFRSVDQAPVQVVFLFLSPEHKPELHLKMMSLVSSLGRSLAFINALKSAESIDIILDLISKAESIVFPQIK